MENLTTSSKKLFMGFENYEKNRYVLDVVVPYFLVGCAYLLFNIPFLILDVTAPSFVRKYKTQPAKNWPVSTELLMKCSKLIFFNLTVTGYVVMNMFYVLRVYFDSAYGFSLPTPLQFIKQALTMAAVEEIGFYYGHRFFHSPYMYKRFHKKHHEWTAPVSVESIYCHPLEHLVCNLGPVLLGPILAHAHTLTAYIWYIVATYLLKIYKDIIRYLVVIYVTTCHHSGYDFPFIPSPKQHDFHHETFNQCYGTIGLLDYIHGTDTKYRAKLTQEKSKKL